MPDLNCPYRFDVRQSDDGEVATCGLLQQMMRLQDREACSVTAAACQACVESLPVPGRFINSVFPSILNVACEDYLQISPAPPDESKQRIAKLQRITEQAVVLDSCVTNEHLATCDVVLFCTEASDQNRVAIQSVLEQQDAVVYLHLVIGDPAAEPLADEYRDTWNVQTHRLRAGQNLLGAIQDIAPQMRCEFFALQHPQARSLSNRVANAVSEMQRQGSDIVGSSIYTPDGEIVATKPTEEFQTFLPWPTLVIRRSFFLDHGGFADRRGDQDIEFVCRAQRLDARIHLLPFATVEMTERQLPTQLGPAPTYPTSHDALRKFSIGYPIAHVDCDVVLPVFGQLEFVQDAIASIIDQEDATAIVHLIDDCGPEDTRNLFHYWRSHPQVRLYRNQRNLGQYSSFNNVSEFFETDLVAVQDGDDISLPHRLSVSGNLLRLCDAEFFAATMVQFGDEAFANEFSDEKRYRRSVYPRGHRVGYFAMNPTACFSVSMFRRLGGYTNFGASESNRGGLDSEFMLRAHFSGVRFALSSCVVAKHRLHDLAATRNSETGFGSMKRQFAMDECLRREKIFQAGPPDPRVYGAINRYRGLTQRVSE
ncbi:glycosyltransferase [Planctomycetes bacterium K23_9]|uniref:Glycosyl transferase family 2 n=1 Tax=Stieleria marina TaxID=1930275 RepID=A0A517NZN6_9BACT|nr:Glycosyl transferase family 2 [Planctomycetes bacterium K23_9]